MASEAEARIRVRLLGPLEIEVNGQNIVQLLSKKSVWLLTELILASPGAKTRASLAHDLWPGKSSGEVNLRKELSQLRQGLGSFRSIVIDESHGALRLDTSPLWADVLEFDAISKQEDQAIDETELARAATLYRGALLETWSQGWFEEDRKKRAQAYEKLQQRREQLQKAMNKSAQHSAENAFDPLRNLPASINALIGRARELEEIPLLFATSRVVNLTGPGGVGKTRLAVEVGNQIVAQFQDGSVFVDFSGLAPQAPLLQALQKVASALQVREKAGVSLLKSITDFLAPRRLMMILDNCEHIPAAAAQIAKHLSSNAPHLHLLTTSRDRLGIEESQYTVSPLELPGRDLRDTPTAFAQIDAVRFFVSRAKASQPEFTLHSGNIAAVDRICHYMDGLPLALDLAAGVLSSMDEEELAAKLDRCFEFLVDVGDRTKPERYRTLEATIAWSYDLLKPEEQALLEYASILSSSWQWETVEAICQLPQAVVLIDQMARKSMLMRERQQGQTRFRLLEMVRQYCRKRLDEKGQTDDAQARRFAHFFSMVENAQKELLSGNQEIWLQKLEAVHDDLLAALAWAQQSVTERESGLRLAIFLTRFWVMRGHYTIAKQQIEAASGSCPEAAPNLRAKALGGLGSLMQRQGDYSAARRKLEASVTIWRETNDQRALGHALRNLGNIEIREGNYDKARSLQKESLDIMRAVADAPGRAYTVMALGHIGWYTCDIEAASQYLTEALEILRETNERDEWGIATALGNLGMVACVQGKIQEAKRQLTESLTIFHRLNEREGIAYLLEAFAGLAATLQAFYQSARLFGCASKLREELGTPLPPADTQVHLAYLASIQAGIGKELMTAEFLIGEHTSLQEAVVYALTEFRYT